MLAGALKRATDILLLQTKLHVHQQLTRIEIISL